VKWANKTQHPQVVEAAERAWGLQLRPGYTPGLAFMAHLWQPLSATDTRHLQLILKTHPDSIRHW
jgi:hypothetical protein